MARRVYRGPKGGQFVVQEGRKVYGRKVGNKFVTRSAKRLFSTRTQVRRRYIRGRGGFKDWIGTAIRAGGAAVGGLAGGISGGPWGAAKGASMGAGLTGMATGLLGLGDYKKAKMLGIDVSGNQKSRAGQMPVVNSSGNFQISHCEYLGNVTGSTSFNNKVYPINPGLPGTFPWLSQIAQNFEQYRSHGIVFKYVTTSVDALNSSNTALGTVTMATNYNAQAPAFATKSEMLNSLYVSEGKPSNDLLHPVETSPTQNALDVMFVRTSPSTDGVGDLRFSDLGNFQIATDGQQSGTNNVLGELWVCYSIEFLKPVYYADVANQTAIYSIGDPTDASPLGVDGSQEMLFDNIGVTFGTTAGNYNNIILPTQCEGLYMFLYGVGSTGSGGTVSPTFTLITSGDETQFFNILPNVQAGSGLTSTFPLAGSTTGSSNFLFGCCFVGIPSAGQNTVVHVAGTTLPEGAGAFLMVVNVNEEVAGGIAPMSALFEDHPELKVSLAAYRKNRLLWKEHQEVKRGWLKNHADRDFSLSCDQYQPRLEQLLELYSDEKDVIAYHTEEGKWTGGWVPLLSDLEEADVVDCYPDIVRSQMRNKNPHFKDHRDFCEKAKVFAMKEQLFRLKEHRKLVYCENPDERSFVKVEELTASQLLSAALDKAKKR